MAARFRLIVGSFAASMFFVSGCVTTSNFNSVVDSSLKPNEGIVVIGLDDGAKGLFWMGDFTEGRFRADGFFPKGFSLATGEPYLVQRAEATTDRRRYGLESIVHGERVFGIPCDTELPVLSLKAGAVQYFGDFSIENNGSGLSVRHSFNLEKAQQYVDKAFPQENWQLEMGEYVVARKQACPKSTIPVILYIYI